MYRADCNILSSWRTQRFLVHPSYNNPFYTIFLERICKQFEIKATKNHAFRKSLNSLIFIPMGINETARASLLGHSVEVNLKHYSLISEDAAVNDARAKLNQRVS